MGDAADSIEPPGAPLLHDAVVQRVDVAGALALLRLRAPGRTAYLLIAAEPGARGVGLIPERPFKGAGVPGAAAHVSEKRRWRSRLEGARVVAITERGVLLAAGERWFEVAATGPERDGSVTLREVGRTGGEAPAAEAGTAAATGTAAAAGTAAATGADEPAYLARGERLVRSLVTDALARRRTELARALARARKRIERRVEAIGEDLARIERAGALAAQASAFVVEAARAPRGARSLVAMDWSTGEGRPIELALDPARGAREQLDAMFKRARRLKLGGAIAERRLGEARAHLEELAAQGARVPAAATLAELEAIAGAARRAAPRDFALAPAEGTGAGDAGHRPGAGRAREGARPYRLFLGAGGARILVGRGAAHNDALTFRTARPHDLWLHAKGHTGAHVIVPLDRAASCPADLLVDAAHLAAHFSDARGEGVVEVQHTPRRHLRKPKGAPPGLVVVGREKVLVLRVEAGRVERLLATEEGLAPP